ncbi:MAG: diphosphomevalonate decarboxylase [Flavobacteriaceae bacterium]|nr:MAG: diphosphomevalonate decarboxylase [Flavobacteriaceae bacterium]
MMNRNFIPKNLNNIQEKGQYTWKSPSNIALVKYWGKSDPQLPKNPSISFTLDACHTITTLHFQKKEVNDDDFSFDIFFEGKKKEDFKPKIAGFFERIHTYMPFLKAYHFEIHSENSFPHSSGIASSASGLSAIALCLMSMEKLMNPAMEQEFFNNKASFLARLGSGSAARSIEGELVVWGEHKEVLGSSNLYGVTLEQEIHPVFKKYQDTILLVDKGEKVVSSTVGHQLMHKHPFAEQRFEQAHENVSAMLSVLKRGDLDRFVEIVESEALTLHAMMMTSMPYFILMKPNTLAIIQKIWAFRARSKSHVCFTLDAGANVHVLYPENEKEVVLEFIEKELVDFCQKKHYICDRAGNGAIELNGDAQIYTELEKQ